MVHSVIKSFTHGIVGRQPGHADVGQIALVVGSQPQGLMMA